MRRFGVRRQLGEPPASPPAAARQASLWGFGRPVGAGAAALTTGRASVRVAALAGGGAVGLASLGLVGVSAAAIDALVRPRPRAEPEELATVIAVRGSSTPGCDLEVTLVGPAAATPGLVGLFGGGGRLLAGPPRLSDRDDAVVRDVVAVPAAEVAVLEPGTVVQVGGNPWAGLDDPLRQDAEQWLVDAPIGPLPVTVAGAARSVDAVVFVHGRGGERATGWWLAPTCADAGWRCAMVAYRNDVDAPATGRYLLGGEWVDVAAALSALATDGVRRVVLVGWSMGGNVCASYLRARHRQPAAFAEQPQVVGLVLDAAALDWGAVLRHVAKARRLPAPLTPVAMTFGQLVRRIDWTDLNHLSAPEHLELPVLAFHGEHDDVVPPQVSERLAAALPHARLVVVEQAGHCRSVNVEPARYLTELDRFLGCV